MNVRKSKKGINLGKYNKLFLMVEAKNRKRMNQEMRFKCMLYTGSLL